MNERLKEFLNQQLDTCRTAISSNPDALQKEFWEGRELANKLALLHLEQQDEKFSNFTADEVRKLFAISSAIKGTVTVEPLGGLKYMFKVEDSGC